MCRNPLALASALAKLTTIQNMVHCQMQVMQQPICLSSTLWLVLVKA